MSTHAMIEMTAGAMLAQIAEVGPLRMGSDRPKDVSARVSAGEGSTHDWLRGIAAVLETAGWEITGFTSHPWEDGREIGIVAGPSAATYKAALAAKVSA